MHDEMDQNWKDRLALVVKSAAAYAPMVGGPLSELIVETIPRLRQDRIVEYVRQLARRLEALEEAHVSSITDDPERIDLIESGGHLAARATSDGRVSQIVEIVYRGLSAEETDFVRRKRLLRLFGEVDDDELVLLTAHGQSRGVIGSAAWKTVKRPQPAHIGASRQHIDEDKLYELGERTLLRLGLLEHRFDGIKTGEYPPFDAFSGGFKGRVQISYLGRMLLTEAGIKLP